MRTRRTHTRILPSRYYIVLFPILICLFIHMSLFKNVSEKCPFPKQLVNELEVSVGAIFDNYTNMPISNSNEVVSSSVKILFDVGRHVDYVDCRKVFDGDWNETQLAKRLSETRIGKEKLLSIRQPALRTTGVDDRMRDCASYIKYRHFIVNSLTDEENKFPIAFSILIYKDIDQFERLLRAIYRPQNSYCVHVDRKSGANLIAAVLALAACFPNIYVPRARIRVYWGTISVLKANLVCMRELYEKNTLWKYLINLTGQEFPLKTNYELVKILTAFNGSNDIYIAKSPSEDRWLGAGDPPHGIKPVKGSLLVAVCRGFVEFAVYDNRSRDFLKWLENTTVPDETFFASLDQNPHLRVPGSPKVRLSRKKNTISHFVNWGDFMCEGRMVRDICVFGVGDLPLLANQVEMFANKFEWNFQRAAYECLEELLYNRTKEQVFKRYSWYESSELN